jgi:hypothetical protein
MMQHRDPAEFVELSAHGQLKTEKLHEGLYLYEPKSTAHFTYPLSRVYDLPVVHEVSSPLLYGPLVACQKGLPRIQALKAILWVPVFCPRCFY